MTVTLINYVSFSASKPVSPGMRFGPTVGRVTLALAIIGLYLYASEIKYEIGRWKGKNGTVSDRKMDPCFSTFLFLSFLSSLSSG